MSTSLPVCHSGILFLRKSKVSAYESGEAPKHKNARSLS